MRFCYPDLFYAFHSQKVVWAEQQRSKPRMKRGHLPSNRDESDLPLIRVKRSMGENMLETNINDAERIHNSEAYKKSLARKTTTSIDKEVLVSKLENLQSQARSGNYKVELTDLFNDEDAFEQWYLVRYSFKMS